MKKIYEIIKISLSVLKKKNLFIIEDRFMGYITCEERDITFKLD